VFWVGREFTLHKFHVWCCRCAKLGVVYSLLHAAACASLPLFTISMSEPASTELIHVQPKQTVRPECSQSARSSICIPPELMSIELDGLSQQFCVFFKYCQKSCEAIGRLARRGGGEFRATPPQAVPRDGAPEHRRRGVGTTAQLSWSSSAWPGCARSRAAGRARVRRVVCQ